MKTMEAVYTYIVLCIFGGLLNLRFTSACVSEDDCNWSGSQCCKYTENGNYLENGICVYQRTCADVCRTQDDCFGSKRCDVTLFRCTTECYSDDHCYEIYGNNEYICSYNEEIFQNQCIKRDDNTDDNDIYSDSTEYELDTDDITKWILIISVILSFCVCCFCLKAHRRSVRRGASQMVTGNAHNPVTTVQQNGDAETLQMNSIQTPPELNGPNLDAIAVSGPPSYIEVGDVPEAPPPTYEEAMGV